MMNEQWKNYFGDRQIKKYEGFVVIVPKEHELATPLACPVCDLIMHSTNDNEYYKSKKCCEKCGMKWADQDVNKWNDGYRPDKKEIEEEVKVRQSIPIGIIL